MKPEEIRRAIEKLDRIPSPSFSLNRILELASDTESDIQKLAESIEADPAVTARVLRLANSAYYGVARDVDSVTRAIVVVGYKNILALATCAALAPAFQGRDPWLDRGALWIHSCATAEASRIVALHAGLDPALAHVSGLLRDFGIVVLSEVMREAYAPLLREVRAGRGLLSQLEREAFGIDHAAAAGLLFERWRLPRRLIAASVCQEDPDRDPTGLARVAALAAGVAARAGFPGPLAGDGADAQGAGARVALGLDEAALEKIAEEVEERREAIEQLGRVG